MWPTRRRIGPAPLRAALERLTDAVPLTEDIAPGVVAGERRRRLDRLARPHSRSATLTVVVAAAAAGLLVLPTVISIVPRLDGALAAWPLR